MTTGDTAGDHNAATCRLCRPDGDPDAIPDSPAALTDRWRDVPSNGRVRDLDPPGAPRNGRLPVEFLAELGIGQPPDGQTAVQSLVDELRQRRAQQMD